MKLNEAFLNSMHEAMTLLQTRGPAEATEAVQRALRGETAAAANKTASYDDAPRHATVPFAEVKAKGAGLHTAHEASIDVEDRGHFSTYAYSNAAGRRQYRLYVPAGAAGEPLPL